MDRAQNGQPERPISRKLPGPPPRPYPSAAPEVNVLANGHVPNGNYQQQHLANGHQASSSLFDVNLSPVVEDCSLQFADGHRRCKLEGIHAALQCKAWTIRLTAKSPSSEQSLMLLLIVAGTQACPDPKAGAIKASGRRAQDRCRVRGAAEGRALPHRG